jgi:hypothetical protein
MNGTVSRFVRFSVALLGLVTLGWVLAGNAAKPVHQRVPLATDWSHGHLIFSHPATARRVQQVQEDPRYWQQMQRQIPRLMPARTSVADVKTLSVARSRASRTPRIHRDWSENLGSGGSVGAVNYPAKFSFDSTIASCANDYVVFSTGLQGSLTQASIVAFNNLYSGCGGTVPSVLWAYDTSPIPAKILTSPALSFDGSQIAFVQTDGPAAQLVLLKWVANSAESVTAPGTPSPVSHANYRTCTAPCMTTFNLGTDDRTSSVFIDYSGDEAWVGDSAGKLHQFSGVFRGTPAEVGGTWPVSVSATALTSPVLDHVTGNVFAGAGDGFLYRVDRSTGAITASGQLDFGIGMVAGPVVDSGNGTVYVSASSGGSPACVVGACSAVYQLATNFAGGTMGSNVALGASSATNPMYNGFFDNAYLTSPNATGNFYVCGNAGAEPTLYQVPINAGAFGTPVAVSALTQPGTNPACSPVTDISNPNAAGGTAERAFVSVQNNGRVCTNPPGCTMNFVTTPWQPLTAYAVGQEILVRSAANPSVLFIQTVIQAGTSGANTPAWGAAPNITTGDPNFAPTSVFWLNQGRIDAAPFTTWSANLLVPNFGNRILDSNGNVELANNSGGTTGASQPVWALTPGDSTTDGSVTWINGGASAFAALPAAGGTSGIIIDNIVGSGTLQGASQVYFSTLSDQACASGGTGSCAVQASQPTLQ